MYTSQSNKFGVGYITSDTKRGLELCHLLSDKLPHGSGINYNWQLEFKRGKIHAYNSYEAMNENGYYCHVYPFHAIYQYNPNRSEPCKYCNGKGYRTFESMRQFGWINHSRPLQDTRIPGWLSSKYLYDNIGYPMGEGLSFMCNVCHGIGSTYVKLFETIRVMFYGQRELSCCGYGLFDYIGDSLCLA